MKKFLIKQKTKITWIIIIIIVTILSIAFIFTKKDTTKNFYIVEEVSYGNVSSGLNIPGTIIAAQKLNLNIYKQINRIDDVNIINGQKVEKGDLLFTFDSSDVSIEINRYSIDAKEARLNITEQKIQNSIENNDELNLAQSIYDLKQKIKNAQRDYFSLDFEAFPLDDDQITRDKPKVSGEYTSTDEGSYFIEVYASNTSSGYSFQYSGLEYGTESIYTNEAVKIGTQGVYVTFSDDVRKGDEWSISFPNSNSKTLISNQEDYEDILKSYQTQLIIAEKNLEEIRRITSENYKSIDLQRAELSLNQANQSLKDRYHLLNERSIIAPFSGTIEAMENVIIGATPQKDPDDPIQFGTLISDEFYVSFFLNATEVTSVSLDQRVLITMTSAKSQEILESKIVEISSLPESPSSPQYKVNALIKLEENSNITLREGILVDIQIIIDEHNDVVRVPSSALEYRAKQASILLVPSLSTSEKSAIELSGVLDQKDTSFESYRVNVNVGIKGQFFTEITSGVEIGDYILVSSSTHSEEGVSITQTGPGGGSGSGAGMMK